MIHEKHHNVWEFLWQAIVAVAIIATCIETPLAVSMDLKNEPWQLWFDGLMSFVFLLDLIHWKKKQQGKKEKGYKAQLLFYAICIIPFDILARVFGFSAWIGAVKMIRCVRVIRISNMFSVAGGFTLLPTWFKVVSVAIITVLAIHTISCGWLWLNPLPEGRTFGEYYIHCVYWAVTTLSTVGYGDVTPSTPGGKLYAMMTMILGVAVFGVVIGNIGRVLAENERHREKSKEKLHDLMIFMKHYGVPKKLQHETMHYYSTQLSKRLSDNDHQIISDLPQALQHELVTYMNVKLIRSLTVFAECSFDCLKEVARKLESVSYSPGQAIIKTGDMGHEMFIINHGTVDIKKSDGTFIANLGEGKFFGEKALLQESPRNADVVAATYCDLYKLEKSNFLDVIQKYPELLHNMEKVLNVKKAS